MENHHSLARQVRRNCSISDAQYAGLYSVCGLAMRLRDLYKWEHSLPPYEEHEASRVLNWIGQKEKLWEELQTAEFIDLKINGNSIDPFDTKTINQMIESDGLYYSAGYAHSLKPSFVLATIETQRTIHGHPVVGLGVELARDLLTLPALTQDNTIVVRNSAIGLYVWDQMLYLNQSGRPFFNYALSVCGLADEAPDTLRHNLPQVVEAQEETFLYHEIGELTDTCFDGAIWRDIVAALPHTPTELLVRTVKDMLADTGEEGTLPQIVRSRRQAGLGFYAAFLDGLGKKMFPEIRKGVARFIQDGDWQAITTMIHSVHGKAEGMARTISAVFEEGTRYHNPAWINEELNRRYIEPLTS